ncbi:16S rRNA (cytidine1402-2'-O)-methyltransferase [Hydrogenivirga caldilitoris]|uniref:Ribosomal RNA small subunit methyltransferase I n=1 Tax=Hydrogenivirga caldilitoris TaxID=246264 RepID=A0A497XVL1_9AQUI|nr:16S rRNA (cytidine(1402)-2'-O)-methyltransferase [Hydrogenivirga caldilitoris]RLJ71192.1 16S rRNA (cytidine1402-2'-O)-methyltransferase [Hydrogenivirga caldilitoris]
MGKLYVVPTPIGNLKDITLRALEVLERVEYIACEDTRRTSILLNHYKIKGKKLISYYEPKEEKQIPRILKVLKEKDVALVSDAGTPSISDPGYRLIRACLSEGIEFEVLPGPSAVITALVGSGLPTDRFLFAGFPPKKGTKRFLEELLSCGEVTFILYESPKRVLKTLSLLRELVGEADVCIARELTKLHEEYIRGSLSHVIEELERRSNLKGEVVLIFSRKRVFTS